MPVKSESIDEAKPKKRAARTITLKAKKAKKSTGEPSARRKYIVFSMGGRLLYVHAICDDSLDLESVALI